MLMLADLGFGCGDGREGSSAEPASGASSGSIFWLDLLKILAFELSSEGVDLEEEKCSS